GVFRSTGARAVADCGAFDVYAQFLARDLRFDRRRELDARARNAILSCRRAADSMARADAGLAHLGVLHPDRMGLARDDVLFFRAPHSLSLFHAPDAASCCARRIRRRDLSRETSGSPSTPGLD